MTAPSSSSVRPYATVSTISTAWKGERSWNRTARVRSDRPTSRKYSVVHVSMSRSIIGPVMIHPDTELRLVSERVGYGVFSTRLIPRGTITWTIDELDRRFEPAAVASFGRVFREIIDK